MQKFSDEQLSVRLRLGDRNAFGEVYTRYWSRVYRFVLKLIGRREQAEDIAQEVFLKAEKGIGSLKDGAALRPWLFTIARNEVYSFFRQTRRNGQLFSERDPWSEDAREEVERDETVEIVQHMIALLKPEYREVLLLREYEQLSYAEISSVTGDSESSVRSRLFKARKALLKRLEPYFGRV